MSITELISRLEAIREDIVKTEHQMNEVIHQVSSEYRHSARNLIHYLCMRTYDLRPIQEALSSLSLSSIGHSEGYTLHNINQVLHWLYT